MKQKTYASAQLTKAATDALNHTCQKMGVPVCAFIRVAIMEKLAKENRGLTTWKLMTASDSPTTSPGVTQT